MPVPDMLLINRIVCNATDDFTGSDELVGVLGLRRFSLGRFSAGDVAEPMIQQSIPSGVGEFVVLERDLTGDDELARVDLLTDMDVDRVVAATGGQARYDISFKVIGRSD